MENLVIEASNYTPAISFDAQSHVLDIRGKSYPENTWEFYTRVFKWLELYLKNEASADITVNIELIYFNSSSSKVLLDLFDLLEESAADGKTITVNWVYDAEDEDALEFGEEFKEDMESLAFNLVRKES